ncbi:pollen-specific leucine-rich repeat extensin-like protein 2 [Echeneis naucrates]|uniref:pollen-specific leucine-rich repeat extensin-like protein 2 n=1 Tax=Echeneis naucrates TaxID=173247 RepID=UPI0011135A1A|nr:pollen-specific leucine-rich repeat extensin-like protein 2 [Echeneis naucrates]
MLPAIALSCVIIVVSAVPVTQQGANQDQLIETIKATKQYPEVQTPAPFSPRVVQPQPPVPQPLGPEGGPYLLPSLQHYTWSPQGDSLIIIPGHPSVHASQLSNQLALPQQPLMFTPYGYFPLFSSPYRNPPFSTYGFPVIVETPPPQIPANQPPNSLALPAETPSRAAPAGDAPRPVQQQQQNPQIVYMLQQPMNSALASLSSEELEMAAKISQLDMYIPTVLTNLPAGEGGAQPVSQAAELAHQQQAGVVATVVTPSAGAPQMQELPVTGPESFQQAMQQAAIIQTSVQPKSQPTQGNCV